MDDFPVDFLGRCGPHCLLVDLTPEEVRKRLEMSLVGESSESFFESAFATNRRYTGKVDVDGFELRPLWRNRRYQPTLTGVIEQTPDGAARLRFQIHMDAKVLLAWILPICILIPLMTVLLLSAHEPTMFVFVAVVLPVMVLFVAVINTLFARHESRQLLQFFVGLFRHDRVS